MAPTKVEEGTWPQLGTSQPQGVLSLTPQEGQGRSSNAMQALLDGDDTPGTNGELPGQVQSHQHSPIQSIDHIRISRLPPNFLRREWDVLSKSTAQPHPSTQMRSVQTISLG